MHDGPSEILLTERINHVRNNLNDRNVRIKKKDTAYWDKGIQENRAKERQISIDPVQ